MINFSICLPSQAMTSPAHDIHGHTQLMGPCHLKEHNNILHYMIYHGLLIESKVMAYVNHPNRRDVDFGSPPSKIE